MPHWKQECGFSPLWDNIWALHVPDFEIYLSQKEQTNIISSVFDIWCLVSSPDMVILVSSILGRGSGDTARQDVQRTVREAIYWGPNNYQDIVDKEKSGTLGTCESTLTFFQLQKGSSTDPQSGASHSHTMYVISFAVKHCNSKLTSLLPARNTLQGTKQPHTASSMVWPGETDTIHPTSSL